MNDETPKPQPIARSRSGLDELVAGKVSVGQLLLVLALGLAGGGGVGSFVGGNAVESVQAAKAEIMGELKTLGVRLDDHGRRLLVLEERLREADGLGRRLELVEKRLERVEQGK